MLKVVYVKVPVVAKTKTDTPFFVITRKAVSNFLKINNVPTIDVISTYTDYDPVSRKYFIAIRFHI